MSPLPKVVFRGRLWDHRGEPVAQRCLLVPKNPLGFVEHDGLLVSTTTYAIDPARDGTFAISVLPTNVGVDQGWHYELMTPIGVYRIQLPAKIRVHDLQKMLSQGSR